jgi:hypothetical protein
MQWEQEQLSRPASTVRCSRARQSRTCSSSLSQSTSRRLSATLSLQHTKLEADYAPFDATAEQNTSVMETTLFEPTPRGGKTELTEQLARLEVTVADTSEALPLA